MNGTLRSGSVVVVRLDYGEGPPREVTVLSLGVRNDRLVFTYAWPGGLNRWAYVTQVDRVVSY